MNNKRAGDAASARVIEEIKFRASMLALHAAIESAANGGESESSREDAGSGRHIDGPAHILVERALRPAGSAEPVRRPNLRGF